jgi:hypothetical protein
LGKIIKFLQLEPWEQVTMLQAATIQIVVRVALGLMPFYMILNILQKIRMVVKHDTMQKQPWVYAWAIRATSPYVPGSRCLCQALAGQVLLALKGFSTELRIGVQKSDSSGLKAHAWLERQGMILIGCLPELADFKPLPDIPER